MDNFTSPGTASFVCDGQFGSTGKGLAAAYLAIQHRSDLAVTNASANAGHTTVIGDRKFVTFHLPTFGVIQQDIPIYLDAGAIINPTKLLEELDTLGVKRERVKIHPRAAVITQEMIDAEGRDDSAATKLASTRKGVGTALSEKIMRRSPLAMGVPEIADMIGIYDLNWEMQIRGRRVTVEVPQGFSLGINSGLAYPYCTSRDCTVLQAMTDAGIHPKFMGKTLMVVRTYPIRVGNIVEDGKQLGTSGPCYSDQVETSWEELGVKAEITTVTKRVRRVFTWSNKQYSDACSINRPDFVMLTFCDYFKKRAQLKHLIDDAEFFGSKITHFSHGPDVSDVVEANHDFNHLADQLCIPE
jgi:adenylosuccinate synthase